MHMTNSSLNEKSITSLIESFNYFLIVILSNNFFVFSLFLIGNLFGVMNYSAGSVKLTFLLSFLYFFSF